MVARAFCGVLNVWLLVQVKLSSPKMLWFLDKIAPEFSNFSSFPKSYCLEK